MPAAVNSQHRRELTVTTAAWVIRTSVKNRVGHELIRTPVANHCRRRWVRGAGCFTD
jgi:hypothetical protein